MGSSCIPRVRYRMSAPYLQSWWTGAACGRSVRRAAWASHDPTQPEKPRCLRSSASSASSVTGSGHIQLYSCTGHRSHHHLRTQGSGSPCAIGNVQTSPNMPSACRATSTAPLDSCITSPAARRPSERSAERSAERSGPGSMSGSSRGPCHAASRVAAVILCRAIFHVIRFLAIFVHMCINRARSCACRGSRARRGVGLFFGT